ncbi:Asparaginyl-tRNA synthase (glutamine-hydrolyzing) [Lentibacillus sp. JNUCC-1]|uniref:Asp-tRNA(Asn)/Glu-tRNA(Gln) amidotransferase subunit GatC n=1 Tax=Lentibacillus sp. JNUCC-1 TaxID=2654513 RepID=UPI0012E8477D|nr:Asp-tRNA(Asn)/Glu-tRNA(Gln) amidotransferase subunit GatC [Lentibacillus sp. JNUCC-1]MUV38605.1 Asparaginyl-tRNA synthase (glutamine-hydrolyzing) [Lentibacillus sp. JNUCC-1]
MAHITRDQVMHVADLARLAITEDEADVFAKDLDNIISYAEQLNELDTEGVEPTTHVLDLKNVMREDEAKKWEHRDAALENAPDAHNGQFKVPSILE